MVHNEKGVPVPARPFLSPDSLREDVARPAARPRRPCGSEGEPHRGVDAVDEVVADGGVVIAAFGDRLVAVGPVAEDAAEAQLGHLVGLEGDAARQGVDVGGRRIITRIENDIQY